MSRGYGDWKYGDKGIGRVLYFGDLILLVQIFINFIIEDLFIQGDFNVVEIYC